MDFASQLRLGEDRGNLCYSDIITQLKENFRDVSLIGQDDFTMTGKVTET
jgi:hypothetical protein